MVVVVRASWMTGDKTFSRILIMRRVLGPSRALPGRAHFKANKEFFTEGIAAFKCCGKSIRAVSRLSPYLQHISHLLFTEMHILVQLMEDNVRLCYHNTTGIKTNNATVIDTACTPPTNYNCRINTANVAIYGQVGEGTLWRSILFLASSLAQIAAWSPLPLSARKYFPGAQHEEEVPVQHCGT